MTTTTGTGSTHGARDHARAMGGTVVGTMPWAPAADAPWWEGRDVAPEDRLHAETVKGGGYTTLVVAAGTHVVLEDVEGDACAHVALVRADARDERLNVADTVKVQWQAYLGEGSLLLSDRGHVLATVVVDTSGRHDAFFGTSHRAGNTERYGDGTAHGPSPAGRELLVLGAAKRDLAPRDVPPTVSFFQGVRVAEDGAAVLTGTAGPGARVVLRAEVPLVVLVADVPHPLDPRPTYTVTPLRVLAHRGAPAAADDHVVAATPEGARALARTLDDRRSKGL